MDYCIEKKKSFTLIGFKKEFCSDNSYVEIPKYWQELFSNHMDEDDEIKQAIIDNMIGEYAVCIDDGPDAKRFNYMIAGIYMGGKVPEGMFLYEVPELEWAIFKAIGPLPKALQEVNTRIYQEWLPNSGYSFSYPLTIEWYGDGDSNDPNYISSIWIPIKK